MDVYGRSSMTQAKREFNSKVAKMALKPLIARARENGAKQGHSATAP
jgi:hypothetical protein